MVVDTSALLAILLGAPVAPRLLTVLEPEPARRLSTASLVEAGMMVRDRLGDPGETELDLLVYRLRLEVVAVTEGQAELARVAYGRWGGVRHAAALEWGECFAYALSASLGEPLLAVGGGFAGTDVRLAAY